MNNRQEQIEQARRLIATGISEDLAMVLYQQFPELKESEDERIRKDICTYLKHKRETCTYPTPKKETLSTWIAYLEKQKENPKTADSIPSNCVSDAKWVSSVLTNAIVSLSDTVDYKCNEPLRYKQEIDDLKKLREEIENQKEQKPAEWSEEDEKNINGISMVLESWDRYHVSPSGLPSLIPGYISWLKSLRPQPEQKRHLGMKDQWCCNVAWAAVRDSDAYNGEEKQFILDFLQRCNPQPHWKPSEEQMDALEKAWLECDSKETSVVLSSLMSDLQKLL